MKRLLTASSLVACTLALVACSKPATEADAASAQAEAPAAPAAPAVPEAPPAPVADATPSFDCGKASSEAEKLVCSTPALAALDRRLAEVYAAAKAKSPDNEVVGWQRGWVKGRDECWKEADRRACVAGAYTRRIAELQALYRLVPMTGPVAFACDGNAANEVTVTYFATEPPTLVAERGDETSLMFQAPAASGARYEGRNESLWEHQGEATITWGYEASPMRCVPKKG